jgi:ABC-type Na+ efflux pump permease subunit
MKKKAAIMAAEKAKIVRKRKKIAAIVVLAVAVIGAIPLIRGAVEQAAAKKEQAALEREQAALEAERAAAERALAIRRAPEDGTYTFEPRLKAQQSGRYIDQWLAKVVARNGNVDLYMTSESEGKGRRSALSFGPPSTLLLALPTDENRSAMKNPVWDEETGAYIITFQNVTSWFRYIETELRSDVIIDAIELVDPDE